MKYPLVLFGTAILLAGPGSISRAADGAAPLHDLGEPQRTQIVATLDTPIEAGKNAVWCASFVAAWKHLQNDLSGGRVTLDAARDTWLKLNDAPDPVRDVPPSALFATAGFVKNGILDAIRKQVAAQFPDSKPPKLDDVTQGIIAYARLELATTFPIPYESSDLPLTWTDASGKSTQVRGFGILQGGGDPDRRAQPRVFYSNQDRQTHEFVLSLNAPTLATQVMIARIPRKATLMETLRDLVQRCDSQRQDIGPRGLRLEDESRLIVPDMAWSAEHSFNDLVGSHFASGPLRDWQVDIARQDIELRLDKNGAEVKSEAAFAGSFGGRGPEAPMYEVTGPFLLAMWQRGADNPFLVVWVENDELLTAFHGDPMPKSSR